MRTFIGKLLVVSSILFVGESLMAFEFHGYLRSGIGASRGGADQVCFRAPGTEGASGKHRLGNECETYGEVSFGERFQNLQDKSAPYFSTHFTLSLVTGGNRDWESTAVSEDTSGTHSQDLTVALREAYVIGGNLVGTNGKLWVGKRFYHRGDIHMLDYYYLPTAGPGAGVEDINLGFAPLSIAVLRDNPDNSGPVKDGPAQTNVDVRLSDITVGEAMKFTPILMYGQSSERGNTTGSKKWQKLSGMSLSLIQNTDFKPSSNMVVLQYGKGLYGADGATGNSALNEYGASNSQTIAKGEAGSDAKDARDDSSTMRLIDELRVGIFQGLETDLVFLWQSADFGGAKTGDGVTIPNKNEVTFGLRPIYSFDENYSLALEYGYTQVDNGIKVAGTSSAKTEFKDAQLQKITIAPQVGIATGLFARPQLRLFATYAKWNDDAKGRVGGDVYKTSTSGFSYGAQTEVWW